MNLTELVKVTVRLHFWERTGKWGGALKGVRLGPLTWIEACRYAFLLDKALLICKRRGDSYDLKVSVNLHSFQVRDDSSGERDNKKVSSVTRTRAGALTWPWGCPRVGARESIYLLAL